MSAFFQDAAHSTRAQVESGTAEDLGELEFAHAGTEHFQPLHEVAGEVGIPIDRLRDLHQGRSVRFVLAPKPGTDRFRRQQKRLGRLFQRPATGRAQFENRHSRGGWIMRSSRRLDLRHPEILDPDLFV